MIIQVEDLIKVYNMGKLQVTALNKINLSVDMCEYVAIMGVSGSGKSTLLNILGCLDSITSGRYYLDGVDVSTLSEPKLASIRNSKIGFVFQSYNLLPKLTALENVMLPLVYAGLPEGKRQSMAKDSLRRVGLADRMNHKPNELSGGQSQKVAIARALVNNPAIVLADEPTGNLDSKATKDILDIFRRLNEEGVTIVTVTHENDVSHYAKRIVSLLDGNIISDRLVEDRLRNN